MTINVALAGNPNCGKTTLFNRLTGSKQRVGNWPGVTVDRKVGKVKGADAKIVDLPGIYSLSPYTPEEIVTRNYILEENPDVVLNIVDASNLERNLYLTLQIMDMGVRMVVALNMMDIVEKRGSKIDTEKLSKLLGCTVVPLSAYQGTGLDELVDQIVKCASSDPIAKPHLLNDDIEALVAEYSEQLKGLVPDRSLRWYAIKMIEKDEGICKKFDKIEAELAPKRKAFEDKVDDGSDSAVASARYDVIGKITEQCFDKSNYNYTESVSEKLDRILVHRIWGLPIFICIIGAMFLAVIGFGDITGIGTYLTDLVNDWIANSFQPAVAEWCQSIGANEQLTGLLVDGIIAGVGAVIGFLPQMLILFVCMCLLEEVGYMARAAFVMDRVFRFFGLSGKSFIPVLVGTGCGVPGIMAAKTIESERDRRITAMTVTFIPCGAKLPIIALIAGALFHNNGLIALGCYILGIAVILLSGLILKKMKSLTGKPAPFIMELPPYHLPSWFNVLKDTLDRGWAFVRKAGTFVLLASVVIWFLLNYDTSLNFITDEMGQVNSLLRVFGEAVCGIFQPLGWGDNWQFTVSSLSGLVAKENLVGTLGVMLQQEVGEEGEEIWEILAGMTTQAAGLSLLIFNLLCAPCFAAIGAMHRELGTWKDTGLAVLYQCLMAYGIASIFYVLVSYMYGDTPVVSGIVVAVISAIVIAYLVLRKDPEDVPDHEVTA